VYPTFIILTDKKPFLFQWVQIEWQFYALSRISASRKLALFRMPFYFSPQKNAKNAKEKLFFLSLKKQVPSLF